MTNKWMKRLTGDFAKLAADVPSPSDSVIKMPSPSLNYCVGNGGITQGKAVCFFGPESGGKSLMMQLVLIQIQQDDPDSMQILFDAEFAFNPDWFKKLGGDLNRLIVRQSNDPLNIFDYIEGEMLELIQEGCPINAIAIDSVKSIRYPKDIKSKTTDLTMGGGGASYLGPALKGVLPVIRKHNITTLMVQQVYEEMDQYKKMRNPWIVPDGRALKHFCDYMLQVEKLETKAGIVEDGKTMTGSANQVGHRVRVKGKKNRVGAPYRVAEFTLRYDEGIVDTDNELVELAKSLGVVFHPIGDNGKTNNQMWQFRHYDKIRGKDNVAPWVSANPKVREEMYKDCMNADDTASQERTNSLETVEINLDEL